MPSNLKRTLAALGATIEAKKRASGVIVENGIREEIRDQALIDTGTMIGSVTHDAHSEADAVLVGTEVGDPPYDEFLNNGTRTMPAKHFLERGLLRKKAELQEVWTDVGGIRGI